MHMYRFLQQVASLLSTERKSSRIFTRNIMLNLFFKIHFNPEEDLSKRSNPLADIYQNNNYHSSLNLWRGIVICGDEWA